MPEQIIITIARPEVKIEYRSESPEAEAADRFAAANLAFHAHAKWMRDLYTELGVPCPDDVIHIVDSDLWRFGM